MKKAATKAFAKKADRLEKKDRLDGIDQPDGIDQIVDVHFTEAVKKNVINIQTLAEFYSTAGRLSRDQRLAIVDQALVMIDQTYVHLPLKRAMHAIEPVQRLRLLEQRLDNYTERAFHNEMISIFVHLRDLHTNYVLPEPYRSRFVFLPFRIEECFYPPESGKELASRYIVTNALELSEPSFKPGVEITHWNGIPIDKAVEINAEREAGSNLDARHLRGLESMTNRWMGMSLPPDEEWVVLRYRPYTSKEPDREIRLNWQVGMDGTVQGLARGSIPGADRLAPGDPHLRQIGIDAKAEKQRQIRKLLFAPDAVAAQQKMADLGAGAIEAAQAFHDQVKRATTITTAAFAPILGAAPRRQKAGAGTESRAAKRSRLGKVAGMLKGVDLAANSIMPDVFKQFFQVPSSGGTFGYIRIETFNVRDVHEFIREFIRIAALLPQDGLIVDVRGNGGGVIAAGEGLLQTMTPKTIEPEHFQLINTPLVLQMCEQDDELAQWRDSVKQAVETGSAFSQGFPLTTPEFCNSIGQKYQGSVVLIVDAGCYSTTDIFAAGFQDHEIGVVLGTSGHTGAGGANVWEHTDLEKTFVPQFKPIPGGASFRVAVRRSTRVGKHLGEVLEDLGVIPDEVHHMTRNDVLNHNVDLIARACKILAGMQRQRLVARPETPTNGSFSVEVTTTNVDRIDALLNGRPVKSLDVKDGATSFKVPTPSGRGKMSFTGILECRGFRDAQLVASTRVQL